GRSLVAPPSARPPSIQRASITPRRVQDSPDPPRRSDPRPKPAPVLLRRAAGRSLRPRHEAPRNIASPHRRRATDSLLTRRLAGSPCRAMRAGAPTVLEDPPGGPIRRGAGRTDSLEAGA